MPQPTTSDSAGATRPPTWNVVLAALYVVGAAGAVYAGLRETGIEGRTYGAPRWADALPLVVCGAVLAWAVLRPRLGPDGGGFGGMLLATIHALLLGAGGLALVWGAEGWPTWPPAHVIDDFVHLGFLPEVAMIAALGALLFGPVPGLALLLGARRGRAYFAATMLGMLWAFQLLVV